MKVLRVCNFNEYHTKNFYPVYDYSDDSLKIFLPDGILALVFTSDSHLLVCVDGGAEMKSVNVGRLEFSFGESCLDTSTVAANIVITNGKGDCVFSSFIRLDFSVLTGILHESEYIEAELQFADLVLENGAFQEIQNVIKEVLLE